jgi:4-amino-4-deoxy-L-arabinose transferase-like glycosyltransferase
MTPVPITASRRETWLFWLFALLILGAGLGLRDPWPADEPRFALVARQMVESGDWLFPHRGSELYSDKPPLFMWLQAAAYQVFGNWRIAFLLPSLLAALGTLWCVTDLGARLWTRRIGLYAGWAVLLAIQFTWQATKAQIDPLVVFWITLANYGLLRPAARARTGGWGWAAAGLGTITKAVGVLALLMLLPAAFASLRGWAGVRLHIRDPKFWLGPLAFVVAGSVWLVPMLVAALGQGGPEYRAYVDDILLRQTVTRYANAWHHGQPPWYFIEVALTAWLPTMLALPWAFPAWRRRLQRRDARFLLPLGWVLLVFVFFSIPSGKRDMYILPALPMLCLALAPLLPGILRKPGAQRLLLGFVDWCSRWRCWARAGDAVRRARLRAPPWRAATPPSRRGWRRCSSPIGGRHRCLAVVWPPARAGRAGGDAGHAVGAVFAGRAPLLNDGRPRAD